MGLEQKAIRSRLRSARERAGLTQDQLAELATVHKRTVETWENVSFPLKNAERVSRLVGVTPEYLLYGDEAPFGSNDLRAAVRDAIGPELSALRVAVEQMVALLGNGALPGVPPPAQSPQADDAAPPTDPDV